MLNAEKRLAKAADHLTPKRGFKYGGNIAKDIAGVLRELATLRKMLATEIARRDELADIMKTELGKVSGAPEQEKAIS